MKKPIFIVLLCLWFFKTSAQDTIRIPNGSFEMDLPGHNGIPDGWGRAEASDMFPDLQPGKGDVHLPAQDGHTYLSLSVTPGIDRQSVSVRFPNGYTMHADETYRISLFLAFPENKAGIKVRTPVILQIKGLLKIGASGETLAEIGPIDHGQWKRYDLELKPDRDGYIGLVLKATLPPASPKSRDGMVLIDHISDLLGYDTNEMLVLLQKKPNKTGLPETFNKKGAELKLLNPSFEDEPEMGKPPTGWRDCGFPDETPPDVQPGIFQVDKKAHTGKTYLGLVVRDNKTYEAVGQILQEPLQTDSLYVFTAWLAKSPELHSMSRATRQPSVYSKSTVFRIWGGKGRCDLKELLATSPPITNEQWQQFNFSLHPVKGNWTYLTLEAYYIVDVPPGKPYNGNLLVDDCSLYKAQK